MRIPGIVRLLRAIESMGGSVRIGVICVIGEAVRVIAMDGGRSRGGVGKGLRVERGDGRGEGRGGRFGSRSRGG